MTDKRHDVEYRPDDPLESDSTVPQGELKKRHRKKRGRRKGNGERVPLIVLSPAVAAVLAFIIVGGVLITFRTAIAGPVAIVVAIVCALAYKFISNWLSQNQ